MCSLLCTTVMSSAYTRTSFSFILSLSLSLSLCVCVFRGGHDMSEETHHAAPTPLPAPQIEDSRLARHRRSLDSPHTPLVVVFVSVKRERCEPYLGLGVRGVTICPLLIPTARPVAAAFAP